MTDGFEDRLKQTLRDRGAEVAASSVDAERVIRRSRIRRAFVGSAAVLGVTLVGFGVVQSLPILLSERDTPIAGSPSPSQVYDGGPGRIETNDHPPVECSGPMSQCITFASGERNGVVWAMYLYKAADRMDEPAPREEWCMGISVDGVGGGGCPASIPSDNHVSPGRSSGDIRSEDVIDGRLSLAVARVEIRIHDYAPFEVPVIPGPEIAGSEDPQVNYFIAFVPRRSDVDVAVYDASGRALQVQEVPQVDSFP